MTTAPPHPRPSLSGDAAPFWRHLRGGVLHIEACAECGALRHPPKPRCARCRSERKRWEPVSGRGEVWSFTVCHPPVLAAFADDVPYNAVVVRLEEGPFLVSNLLGVASDDLEVGMAVELVAEPLDGDLVLPKFRPAPA
jgi:uncharacterized OB-fold protein